MKNRYFVWLAIPAIVWVGLTCAFAQNGPAPADPQGQQPGTSQPAPRGPIEDPNAPQPRPDAPIPRQRTPVPDPNKPIQDPNRPDMPHPAAPPSKPQTPPM